MKSLPLIAAIILALAVSACGIKRPLELPGHEKHKYNNTDSTDDPNAKPATTPATTTANTTNTEPMPTPVSNQPVGNQ